MLLGKSLALGTQRRYQSQVVENRWMHLPGELVNVSCYTSNLVSHHPQLGTKGRRDGSKRPLKGRNFHAQHSQPLAENVVQLASQASVFLFLCGNELGSERPKLRLFIANSCFMLALCFLSPLALGD